MSIGAWVCEWVRGACVGAWMRAYGGVRVYDRERETNGEGKGTER